MMSKSMATLSQCLQCIFLCIYQCRVCPLYKPGCEPFIEDWLSSHNHDENKDRDIQGLSINTINATVDLSVCISKQDIQEATAQDANLHGLKAYIIHGCLHKKDEVAQDIQKYWPIRHELAMIDGVAVKGKGIIMPSQLQMQILSQLHSNHMEIEKMRLFVCESVYWLNVKANIENAIKHCSACLEYQNI